MHKKTTRNAGLTNTGAFMAMEDLQKIQNISSIQPINLDYCGSEQCSAGYAFGPFIRTSYVLHMVTSGKGILRKEGKSFSIQAGEAFLIYPKEETIYQADEREPWHYLWIGFHGFQAEDMMSRAGFSRDQPVIQCRNMDKISRTMDVMLAARDLSYIRELERMSALYRLLALLTENGSEDIAETKGSQSADSLYVQTAVNLLLGNYQKGIRVTDVAKAIGISRNYLTTIFKKEMNVSPQEFLMNYRMEKAASLLTTTREPVSVIASEVGYTDSLSFSKAFRKRYGCSPTEYRESRPTVEQHSQKGDYTSELPL